MQLPNRSERIASMLAGSVALVGLVAEKQLLAHSYREMLKALGLFFAAVIYTTMRWTICES